MQQEQRFDYYAGVSHVNIAVPDVHEAIEHYRAVLGAVPVRMFERFKNIGFAKSAGFLDKPEDVEVSIAFLDVPGARLTLELMQYHAPAAVNKVQRFGVHEVCGVRHIALKVTDIDRAFHHVRAQPGVTLMSPSADYRPFKIDDVGPEEFALYGVDDDALPAHKQHVCEIVGKIRYFYFLDQYGVQWEFEQGHSDIGSD